MTSLELKLFTDVINACIIADEMQPIALSQPVDSPVGDKAVIAYNDWMQYINGTCYQLDISAISCFNAARALTAKGLHRVKPTQVINFFHR